jgi:hypothetical protein
MPILDVDSAKTIVVIKRSMRRGSGIDNELHTNPKTRMYFADAKAGTQRKSCARSRPSSAEKHDVQAVAKNRREQKEETRWHIRPSTRTTTRQSPPSTTSPTSS